MELKFHKNAKIFFVNDSGMVENSSALMKASYEVRNFKTKQKIKKICQRKFLQIHSEIGSMF